MGDVLANPTYRRLFLAQVIALAGTGLATVALGLLAFELAGDHAGLVLGTALAIKMIAYVTVAPVATALVDRLPRRRVLVALDLVRAVIVLGLPWVSAIWQVYVLIFLLQAASAAFTPTFQATIPDVLPKEADYTRALSLARLANDLETALSPLLAAVLLLVISFHSLFAATAVGFVVSAALVARVVLPAATRGPPRGIYDRTTRGLKIYLATPRLRGLLALNLAVAAGGAMVLVNTVVIVQGALTLSGDATAVALAAFGAGSMIAAVSLPRLLEAWPDRPVMLAAAAVLTLATAAAAVIESFAGVLGLWLVIGACYSAVQTPSGRLLARSAHTEDRPAVYAAQFALSHACWLVTYPVAGWVGGGISLAAAALVLAGLASVGVVLAALVWPQDLSDAVPHHHPDLPEDHPHLAGAAGAHRHPLVIDDLHPHWPR
jgi:MFS family permease